jgi:hypothetical protein
MTRTKASCTAAVRFSRVAGSASSALTTDTATTSNPHVRPSPRNGRMPSRSQGAPLPAGLLLARVLRMERAPRPPPRPGCRPPAPAVVPVARTSPSGTPVTVWRRSGSFFVAMSAKLLHGKISFRDNRLTGLGGAGQMSFQVPGKSSEPGVAADARPCRNIVAVQMMPGHQDHHRDESHTTARTGQIFSAIKNNAWPRLLSRDRDLPRNYVTRPERKLTCSRALCILHDQNVSDISVYMYLVKWS